MSNHLEKRKLMVDVGNCAYWNTFSYFPIPELWFIGRTTECVFLKSFLNSHTDSVPSADSHATQAGPFSQMGFLGWDFHCVFPDKCSMLLLFVYED